MDRVVERKRIDKRILIGGGAAAVLLLILLFWLFAPRVGFADGQAEPPDHLGRSKHGTFEDFLPLAGAGDAAASPSISTRSRAAGSSRWSVEDGAQVVKGQLLAVLSNADLQLSTLARQTEVEQQLNNMRSQELALAQTRSANLRDLNQARNRPRQGAAAV